MWSKRQVQTRRSFTRSTYLLTGIYDLLCLEGLAIALRVFSLKDPIPTFRVPDIPRSSVQRMVVKPETSLIRPHIVCAVLWGVTFDEARYNGFIDLQDKLHQNLCRRRTLVAIGTHDLDTLEGPFTYEALAPADIKFVPLKQTKEFNGLELMEFYKGDFYMITVLKNSVLVWYSRLMDLNEDRTLWELSQEYELDLVALGIQLKQQNFTK